MKRAWQILPEMFNNNCELHRMQKIDNLDEMKFDKIIQYYKDDRSQKRPA